MQNGKEIAGNTGMEGVNHHNHLCLIYEEEAEILAPVIPFIQKGVAQGERCIYLNAGEEMLERVLKNAISGRKSEIGALLLLPARETWLQGGNFDPARVMGLMQSICSSAAGDGFKGTRIICDMGWAGGEALKEGTLIEFELGLNLFAERNDVALLCLYNRRTFSPERILELAKIHSHLVIGGKVCSNPFFVPPKRILDVSRATCELDLFLAEVQVASGAVVELEMLRHELEQAYAALARKIYENWQEEDTLRISEKELHEKDEVLMVHRRRLQTVLQHLPVMLMAFDMGNRLTACNHEFERVTGFRAEEVMGRLILDLIEVKGEGREELVEAHPVEGGNYRERKWNIRCKNGSLKSVSWSNISQYVPISGWTNWIMGLDVTPRVNAELGLRSLNDELKARTGDLEAFGYAVSSDLSGQLAKISGHCTVMKELYWVALAQPCRDILRGIDEATIEMVGRITALQRFTTLTAEEFRPEQVDLSAMVAEIAARLKGSAGERRVTFSIEDGVTAIGDKKLLLFAMEQLLENAWNCTCGVQHPLIRFGTTQVDGGRSIFISDNGPRFTGHPEDLSEPRRLDSATKLGSGIGLVTVQRIISLHRGTIWTADEAGPGATFYFRV